MIFNHGKVEKNEKEKAGVKDFFKEVNGKCECQIKGCPEKDRYFSLKSSTSTLRRHYDSHFKEANPARFLQNSLDNFMRPAFNQKISEEFLIKWMISSNSPFSCVENKDFVIFFIL